MLGSIQCWDLNSLFVYDNNTNPGANGCHQLQMLRFRRLGLEREKQTTTEQLLVRAAHEDKPAEGWHSS